MSRVAFIGFMSLLVGCTVAHTGHLIVSLTDRETNAPITNATVSVQVQTKRSYGGHSTPSSNYRTVTANTDSNGISNVEFLFYYSNFDWWVKSPTHYCHRYRVGSRNEFFKRVVEKSDYFNIDTNTVQGLAMYNELVQLESNNDYLGFVAKFSPKSETYTNNIICRSVCLTPKHNPQPMYGYGPRTDAYLPVKNPTLSVTNGIEVSHYKPVDFDMKECLVVSYKPDYDEFMDGPAGRVSVF